MTELDSKRRDGGAGTVAPALVVAALTPSLMSVADVLRAASFQVAQTSSFDETRSAAAIHPGAILLLDYPVEPSLAEWLAGRRLGPTAARAPILLLCAADRLEEASASPLGDLALAADVPGSVLVQSVRLLLRLASSERALEVSAMAPPVLRAPDEKVWPALFRDLPFGFLVVDDAGRIIEANRSAVELLMPSHAQLIGASLSDVLGDSGVESKILAVPAHTSWLAGDFVRTRNDEILELEYLAKSAIVSGKHVVILHDATTRNRRQALEHRAEKMDSLGRLVGGMAHEFNNLLTVILGYSDLSVRLAAADSRFSDALLQIKNSAERGAHLTQLLLAFGRKQVMAPVWIDLNHLLFDLEEHIRLIVGPGAKIEIQMTPSLPRVFVDPMLVQRALVQIVTNARDVMPEHGVLRLATTELEVLGGFASRRPELQPGRYVCLSIHDNGPGIPSDIKPFVFEPFFTTKSFGQGIGMGLAFVDGVMNQSGGSVDVVSELGEGATFRLFFTTVNNAPPPSPMPATPGALPPTHAGILLVDDDEGVRRFAGLVLREQGYQVLEACDGAEALALVDQNVSTIDLVVTDVFMPVMGGVELGNRLALLHPGLPILYQSGRLEDMRQTAGSHERNLHFLTKPFSRDALLAKVSQLVRR